jgi:NADPH-dependent 2,4-dienoyl-CoA reductase/sulfur reductase-like enzyme/Fe-S-cluster-containing hydrogenase component 2/bacterioferritin-associated ferredoxin
MARAGETIAAALLANGVRTFGHHPYDQAPQGIFCANGQCAQCLVLAGGRPVKACVTPVRTGMQIEPVEGRPVLPPGRIADRAQMRDVERMRVPVLIVGGGPAGVSAAIELGNLEIETLLIDDKQRLGGKLVLQTHRFFGSVEVYAGVRGIEIAAQLEARLRELAPVEIWLNSTALAVFADRQVGILRHGSTYVLVEPQVLLVAAGARERSLAFPGNTLPGVYGAGAFQTLVNRDRICAAERLFIVGGGNVGLIAGYHAVQAGIEVVGLVEAMPTCGGYRVHRDKLARLGVPIYSSHTIVSANGTAGVESVTIARVDDRFNPLPGTEQSFACDTVLIAVGLNPVDEFYRQAQAFGMAAFAAGDAQQIAEASAAMYSGRIEGREIARALGRQAVQIPDGWRDAVALLRSGPGQRGHAWIPEAASGVMPILHCDQQIPCNPCVTACPQSLIYIPEDDIRQPPVYLGEQMGRACLGCARCVVVCPGLAITLVDYRPDAAYPTVTVPYEFGEETVDVGDRVLAVDAAGEALELCEVTGVRAARAHDHTLLIELRVDSAYAKRVAGIRVWEGEGKVAMDQPVRRLADDAIVCRCERVTAGAIRVLIRQGCRDINEIKARTRAGMGACGGKTCVPLIHQIYREEGIAAGEIVDHVPRPLFVEVPLGVFAGLAEGDHDSVL